MDINLLYGMFVALFSVLDPIGNLPVFIDATALLKPSVRAAMAVLIACVIFVGLAIFLFLGQGILHFFGISLPAFQIAGGIVLLITGLHMVAGRARGANTKIEPSDMRRAGLFSAFDEAGAHLKDIIVPVGIPLFVGPGSLSTVVLYSAKADGHLKTMTAMTLILLLVSIVTGLILMASTPLSRVLGRNGLQIATRILGLLITAIGVQFTLDGLAAVTTIFDAGKLVS
jgi:multiple antibiotic resistance protein